MKRNLSLLVLAVLLVRGTAGAQIPVEVFGGSSRSTLDIMFFKFFHGHEAKPSRWLFFSRGRSSFDYRMTDSTFLPQFSITEAVSYNHPKLHGAAPVLVMQASNAGIFPKAGLQYAHVSSRFTAFGWVVCEARRRPGIDLFALARYTPYLSKRLLGFLQFEAFGALATDPARPLLFVQRARVGLGAGAWRWGLGADLAESGRGAFTLTYNPGVFLRHEF